MAGVKIEVLSNTCMHVIECIVHTCKMPRMQYVNAMRLDVPM